VGAGNKNIFRSARDFERFIKKIQDYTQTENRVRIIAYCLTSNSYHLILEEIELGATAQLIHRLSVSYAMYFNARYKELGHLFRGPYKESQIENDDELIKQISTLHAMPLRQKISPDKYRWSSYTDYLKQDKTWLHLSPIEQYFQDADFASEVQASMELHSAEE
jgi:REP element-mobilizing transposase RayT